MWQFISGVGFSFDFSRLLESPRRPSARLRTNEPEIEIVEKALFVLSSLSRHAPLFSAACWMFPVVYSFGDYAS
jgi:hypothetical protein